MLGHPDWPPRKTSWWFHKISVWHNHRMCTAHRFRTMSNVVRLFYSATNVPIYRFLSDKGRNPIHALCILV